MQIVLNGEPREVADGLSVGALLDELGVERRHVAVELNRELVPRTRHEAQPLAAGDRLELVTLVGGG